MDQTQVRDTLIRQARATVGSIDSGVCPLSGACVVSSVAAGDFTPASDVDMLMVAADGEGRPGVQRRLVGGRVFEWCVVPETCFTDTDSILADAGLTHDVLTAVILMDKTGRLAEARKQVELHYREPDGVWLRAAGQLQRIRDAVSRMRLQVDKREILLAQRSHVSVLKAVFGLPRALLNKRCTMTRGLPFCREATEELGWQTYVRDALDVFGVASIDAKAVRRLHSLAREIVAATGFSEAEKAILVRRLEGSRWLLANCQPADAVWPLWFWSSSTVAEAGGERNNAVWEPWQQMAATLGLHREDLLAGKAELAQQFFDAAIQLVDPKP